MLAMQKNLLSIIGEVCNMYDASAVTSMMGYGAGPLFWSDKSSKMSDVISDIMYHACNVCM